MAGEISREQERDHLRIGIDGRSLIPPMTGIGHYLKTVIEAWDQPGDEFYLYMPNAIPAELKTASKVVIKSTRGIPPFIWKETVLPWLLTRDGINVFWGPQFVRPLWPIDIPTVISIHDMLWLSENLRTMGLKNRVGSRVLVPRSISSSTKIIVLNSAVKYQLSQHYPQFASKMVAILPPVTFDSPVVRKQNGPVRLLAVNTIEPRKNIRLLVDVLLELNREQPMAELDIVGKWGWESIDLKRRLSLLSDSGIRYHGYVPQNQLDRLYSMSDFVISTSKYEGTGLPYVEALGRGIPVVAMDNEGLQTLRLFSPAIKRIPKDTSLKQWVTILKTCCYERVHFQKCAQQLAPDVRRCYSPMTAAFEIRKVFVSAVTAFNSTRGLYRPNFE